MKIVLSNSLASKKIFIDGKISGYVLTNKKPYQAIIFQEGPKTFGDNSRNRLTFKPGDTIINGSTLKELRQLIKEYFEQSHNK